MNRQAMKEAIRYGLLNLCITTPTLEEDENSCSRIGACRGGVAANPPSGNARAASTS